MLPHVMVISSHVFLLLEVQLSAVCCVRRVTFSERVVCHLMWLVIWSHAFILLTMQSSAVYCMGRLKFSERIVCCLMWWFSWIPFIRLTVLCYMLYRATNVFETHNIQHRRMVILSHAFFFHSWQRLEERGEHKSVLGWKIKWILSF